MTTLILNAQVVNENQVQYLDVIIENGHIKKIERDLQHVQADRVIDAKGLFLMPGVIDDQVHFREPGLTHKASIYTESKAAVAGGVAGVGVIAAAGVLIIRRFRNPAPPRPE